MDKITSLECELSFLGGKLNERLTLEEKQIFNDKFILTARELNTLRSKVKQN